MKLSIGFLMVAFLFFGITCIGQEKYSSYEQFKDLPREKVYISLNSTLLFTGEYLYYKMYCLNDKTKQPSKISTIGYVELINEDKQVIFKHKIRLNNSQGQGDFFVPTTVPSGNYKLIGYTKWMRNGSIDLFFQEDISIINPYQANQDGILPNLNEKDNKPEVLNGSIVEKDKRFVLTTDKDYYPKKSKVTLELKNFRGASGYGNYTVSVRRKENLKEIKKLTPESYIQRHQKQADKTGFFYENIQFTPELDGELIKGRIVSIDGSQSEANIPIGVSIPGEDFQMKLVRTDSSGVFNVNINTYYTVPLALFQIIDDSKDLYEIKMEKDFQIDYTPLDFQKFYIDSDMQDAIVKRSVHNQIENGYFSVKPDTLHLESLNDPYGGAFVEIVDLEDFTRFKTLDETIVELVPNVWTKKNKEGKRVFKVRSFDETYEESKYDALLYIDGVFITEPANILEFDTRTVKSIHTVRQKYLLGGKYYYGMVSIVTNTGNYFDQLDNHHITKHQLNSPQAEKNYFNQNYPEGVTLRIPDFRNQLVWKPSISFEGRELDFSFYTSDVEGEYEVILEGFSIYGRPVTVTETFTVN